MSYISENAGFLTSSKLKHFMVCPETYRKKYELGQIPEENNTSLATGTAFDYFVSYGEDSFLDKYEILEPRKRRAKEGDFCEKIQFTNSDGETLISLISEAKRQPFFELHSEKYKAQETLTAEFRGVKLKGTLDRIDYESGIIRDTKTCRDSYVFKAIQQYGYIFSMAFYEILYEAKTEKRAGNVILDFFTTTAKNQYIPISIPKDILEEKRMEIVNAILFFKECTESGDFPSCAEIGGFEDSFLKCPCPQHCSGCEVKNPIVFQNFY